MLVNGKEFDVNELVKEVEPSFLKRRNNGLLLSDNDILILQRNGLNYLDYHDLKSLLFAIEEVLKEDCDLTDLEELSIKLGEYNYYNYTNK